MDNNNNKSCVQWIQLTAILHRAGNNPRALASPMATRASLECFWAYHSVALFPSLSYFLFIFLFWSFNNCNYCGWQTDETI